MSQKIIEWERSKLGKLNPLLPPYFKTIGWSLLIGAFVGIFIARFGFEDKEDIVMFWLKNTMILSLLVLGIAKEKMEDERIQNIRMKSLSLALIFGVIYAVVQPIVDFGVDQVIDSGNITLESYDAFTILTFMLIIHIGFFNVLKR